MRRVLFALLILLMLTLNCHAVSVYYIAPAGNDSAAGTMAAPWKTFTAALPKLHAGDTLLLLPGTYTVAANGKVYAGCTGSQYASGARDGTAAAPVTIKAQGERQALLQGDGHNVVELNGCEYWVIEGLYVRNTDVQVSGWEGSGIVLQGSSHITLRRNLIYGPNAYFNSHGMALYLTNHSLLEDNEVYYVARHAIIIGDAGTPSDGNTLRRNYVHSRGHADMPGGYVSAPGCGSGSTRGDEGISCYPCKNSLMENNIIEDFDSTFTIQCKQDCGNNRYFGNISLANGCGGIGFTARGEMYPNSVTQMPTDELVVNHVTVGSTVGGGGCTGCKNLVVDHMTVVGNASGFGVKLGSLQYGEQGDGVSTFTGTNLLIAGNQGVGFEARDQASWSVSHSLLWQNTGGYNPALSDAGYSTILQVAPQLGACLVYIPDGSPAKRAGTGGSDIGATILTRYLGGTLTETPLWHPTSGAFPCGAVVAGVNDVPGKSCRDVHERLHVGAGGCPLPTAAPPAGGTMTAVLSQIAYAGTDAQGYAVHMKTGAGPYQEQARIAASVTTHTIPGLVASMTYCFRMQAYNASGGGPGSPEQCTTAAASVPTGTPTFRLSTTTP